MVESIVEYLLCDTFAVASVAALGYCAPRVEIVKQASSLGLSQAAAADGILVKAFAASVEASLSYSCTEQSLHHAVQTAAEDVRFDELAADPGSPRPEGMLLGCLQAILIIGRCFAWAIVPAVWAVAVVVVAVAVVVAVVVAAAAAAEDVDEKGAAGHSQFGAGISLP